MRCVLLVFGVGFGLLLAACTSTDGSVGAPSSEEATRSTSTARLNASTLVATDDRSSNSGAADPEAEQTLTTTSGPTTTSATTTATLATITAAETTTTTTTTTIPPTSGQVVEPGEAGIFTSPSGNIACNMSSAFGVSCWIGQKSWTIEESLVPGCEDDFGGAVDLAQGGVLYPCYTDLSWNLTAPALPYGDRMNVGEFSCLSTREGVICNNAQGKGFQVARAALTVF